MVEGADEDRVAEAPEPLLVPVEDPCEAAGVPEP
jgi:hypothetical protein